MSKIIVPNRADIAGLEAESKMTRKERKLLERLASQPVTRGELPMAVARIVEPGFKRIYDRSSEVALTVIALCELMIEKGVLTREEVEAKENEIVENARKAAESAKNTPNSPALEEATKNAEGREVSRLDEVPPRVVTEDEESAQLEMLLEG